MTIETFFSQPIVQRLGWTLAHFIWQGAAVMILLTGAMLLLRRRTANSRYCTACAALLVMAVLPVVTFRAVSLPASLLTGDLAGVVPAATAGVESLPPSAVPVLADRAEALSEGMIAVEPAARAWSSWWRQRAFDLVEPFLPWMVCGWLAGVLVLSVRLLGGWTKAQRLKRMFVQPAADRWQETLANLARRLMVSRPVRLLESAVAQVPMAVGWLRPVILLPASTLSGLTPQQLESLIAHELAHISRYDYLVNLLQTVVETLLFYHPAVWWVSHSIRVERENCCDDLAVSACGDTFTYARALVELEQLRTVAPLRLAVASKGGSLMSRIRRLVGASVCPPDRSSFWLAGLIGIAAVIAVGACLRASALGPGDINQAAAPVFARTGEDKALVDTKMAEMREKLKTVVSLSFKKDTDIRDVLEFLSDWVEVNILLDERVMLPPVSSTAPGVEGARSKSADIEPTIPSEVQRVYLKEIPLGDALEAFLKSAGLGYSVQPEFIWVSRPDVLETESFDPVEARLMLPHVRGEGRETLIARLKTMREKLRQGITVNFAEGTDIRDVLEFLSDWVEMNFVLDERVMLPFDGATIPPVGGIERNVESTIRRIYLRDIPLGDALAAMLRQNRLDYRVLPEFIWISRPDVLERESIPPRED